MNAFDRSLIAAALESYGLMLRIRGDEKRADRSFQLAAMFRKAVK